MPISKLLSEIPDSYFGKTMGRKVEHGPLPLINMAVGVPDGETPKVIVDEFIKSCTKARKSEIWCFSW